jgi:plastocyanin
VVAAIAGIAFFASYRYATAASSSQNVTGTTGSSGTVASASSGGCCGSGSGTTTGANSSSATTATTTGGGCCGGGATGTAVTKSATVSGGVQKISVDLSKGYYNPSTIQLKAGIPAEITFGQSSGCTGVVQSQQLGFSEDLSGGAKTVKIAALQAGTYQFACGMGMVTGSIVVK